MENRYIKNNKQLIIELIIEHLKINITEEDFKIYLNDEQLYLTYLGKQYIVKYRDDLDIYEVLDINLSCNPRLSHHYHLQFSSKSITKLIKKLSNTHNPVSMNANNKIDSITKLFGKLDIYK